MLDLTTEDQAKHKVMKMLFSAVFYGFTNCFIRKNMSNLNTPSFLRVAAKYLRRFSLLSVHKPLQALTLEKRSFLTHLEECIESVVVSQCVALSKKEAQTVLYILHRLLDHGVARKLIIHVQCPAILAWLLRERGPQHVPLELESVRSGTQASSAHSQAVENRDHPDVPAKLRRRDSACPSQEVIKSAKSCHMFPSCDGASAGPCPRGRVEQLEVSQCGPDCLTVLTAALPTFFCLRSLNLHSLCKSDGNSCWKEALLCTRDTHTHTLTHQHSCGFSLPSDVEQRGCDVRGPSAAAAVPEPPQLPGRPQHRRPALPGALGGAAGGQPQPSIRACGGPDRVGLPGLSSASWLAH